jgi:D-alanine-D-alanine ligase
VSKKRVLVLCGGRSAERDVSLVSARTVVGALLAGYEVDVVAIDASGRWRLASPELLSARVSKTGDRFARCRVLEGPARFSPRGKRADVVFPVLHGPLGEDGTMQGLLEVEAVPYVGCGVLGSSVGMDKEYTKIAAERAGLPVLPWAVVREPREAAALARRLRYPVFAKPARMGSSVGVSKVKKPSELAGAIRTALRYDDKAILEHGIAAREVETAVLGDPWAGPSDPLALKASICGEIAPSSSYEFYDYKSKYIDPNGAKLMIPAPVTKAQSDKVRALALAAFRALDCFGMGRVDFLMDKKSGKIWFNEINTIPGFTSGSMYPLLWKETGLPPSKLVDRLIALALRRQARRARISIAPQA